MGKINVLSFAVANLIAAGEVVDRPSSVVKELIENSIDSGATRITVEIMRGGVSFIRVADNGCGIAPDDLPVAIKRHATSKIKSADDLDGIKTLGFRGEALAAICAVSTVRIISKPHDAALGAVIEVRGGVPGEIVERGASNGTTIIVEELFANVPARLKFLKKDSTESMSVCSVIEKIALSHPEIAFLFISDGNIKVETSGNGDLRSAVRSIYGKQFCEDMLEVSDERDGVKISGFITSPMQVRANRNLQTFFINGRYVKTKMASAALEQAFVSYIQPEKFPGCVLKIEIPPETVDVNVHPAKLEVKFSNEKPIFDAVYYSVRHALTENEKRPELELPSSNAQKQPSFMPASVLDAFVPVSNNPKSEREEQLRITSRIAPTANSYSYTEAVKALSAGINSSDAVIETSPDMSPDRYLQLSKCKEINEKMHDYGDYIPGNDKNEPAGFRRYIPDSTDPPFVRGDTGVRMVFPEYRIVGQIFNSYVIVERDDTCLIIDEHAAHERMIFERLKHVVRNTDHSIVYLAVPLDLMLMSNEIDILEQYRESINSTGFSFERKGNNSVTITSIPEEIDISFVAEVFETLADGLVKGTGNVELTQDLIFDKALYQASCKAAVKAGRVYPWEYLVQVIDEIMKIPDITYCPHGRPVAMELKKSTIDHRFKRS